MNNEIVFKMIQPYVKQNAITYEEFDNIFSMLSRHEQYAITDYLYQIGVDLVVDRAVEEADSLGSFINANESKDDEAAEFQILYDDEIFRDSIQEENSEEYIEFNTNITQTNELLCQLLQEGDRQAKQDLCVKNKRLVDKYVAAYEKYYGNRLSFEDLEQAGMCGLIKAGEKFDAQKGYSFSTYAVWWIRQHILREIYDNGFAIRIPVHMMEKISKVTKMDNEMAVEGLDFEERMKIIGKELGISEMDAKYCIVLRNNYLSYSSLNTPIGEDHDTEMEELVIRPEEKSVEDIVFEHELHDCLVKMLETLKDRERDILILRFGFNDGRARTLEEIAEMYGVTRERIRQIEAKAIKKMRSPSMARMLCDFDSL